MTESRRCPSCGRPAEPDWSACPFCRADLAAGPPPRRRPVPAAEEGRRDHAVLRYGLGALGVLGALWVILALVMGAPIFPTLVGALLLFGLLALIVMIVSVLAGSGPGHGGGRDAPAGPASGPDGSRGWLGAASVLVKILIGGALVFTAIMLFLFFACVAVVLVAR